MQQTPSPRFSIVIPCWNEAANLAACVASIQIAAASGHQVEIILVDNGSSDASVAIARELGVQVLENTTGRRVAIAALRNRGAAASRGEILCFLDADMRVPPDWLDTLEAVFIAGHVGLLGFVETTPRSEAEGGHAVPWVARVWGERFALRRVGVRAVDFLPGRNMNLPRATFAALGGFDETLLTSEDKDFTLRAKDAGLSVLSTDRIVLVHTGYEHSLAEFLRKEFWRQGNSLAFARKHKFRRRTLRQPLMAAWHFWYLMVVAAFPLGVGTAQGLVWLAMLWVTPSAASVWMSPARRKPWLAMQLTVLEFIRWNVAGVALARQVVQELNPVKR